MKLPFEEFNAAENILPYDGALIYYSTLNLHESPDAIYKELLHKIEWYNDKVTLFGKTIVTKRKIALFADKKTSYTYSNQQKIAVPWIEELLPIKHKIEEITGETFNCCLCNLYHDGSEGMGWHADNEKVLDQSSSIASVSFGAERYFSLKHRKTNEKLKIALENGSLLLMKPPIQEHWLHALPKSKKIKTGRINLTFRTLKSLHSILP